MTKTYRPLRPNSGAKPRALYGEITFRANGILDHKRTGSRISGAYQEVIDRVMYYGALIRNGDHYGGMR